MLRSDYSYVSPLCTQAPELHVELHKHGMSQQAMMGGGPSASSTSTKVSFYFLFSNSTKVYSIIFVLSELNHKCIQFGFWIFTSNKVYHPLRTWKVFEERAYRQKSLFFSSYVPSANSYSTYISSTCHIFSNTLLPSLDFFYDLFLHSRLFPLCS